MPILHSYTTSLPYGGSLTDVLIRPFALTHTHTASFPPGPSRTKSCPLKGIMLRIFSHNILNQLRDPKELNIQSKKKLLVVTNNLVE